ncbi:MAG: HD domain-containing protein, partial [Acidimicrobiales bacterium]
PTSERPPRRRAVARRSEVVTVASELRESSPRPEPVVAAFDFGSNSFHLLVVRGHPDRSFDVLLSEKEMLRLGEEVGLSGKFSPDAISRAAEVATRFHSLAVNLGADEFVCVATAAFREAENASTMVEAIRAACGLDVSVISGHREAELIFHAVRSFVHVGAAPIVAADLGGGSLEISVGDQRQQYFGASLRLGVGRLIAKYPPSDPPTRREIATLRRYVIQQLGPVSERARDYVPTRLVVTSGSFNALVRTAEFERFGGDPEQIKKANEPVILDVDAIEGIEGIVLGRTAKARLDHPAIDTRRNDQLPYGYILLRMLIETTGVTEVVASPWALREGLVLDALERRADFEFSFGVEELRSGSVKALAGRFLPDLTHVTHVARLAVSLGAQLPRSLALEAPDLELLSYACLLHDIGESIAQDNHDRHSAYIVESVRLRGFSREEKAIIASLVRYHRRGTPKASEYPPFGLLDHRRRERFMTMLAVLRVADALDRSHQSFVHEVSMADHGDSAVLEVHCVGDVTLELYGIRRKGQLLEKVLGRVLEISVVSDDVATDEDP